MMINVMTAITTIVNDDESMKVSIFQVIITMVNDNGFIMSITTMANDDDDETMEVGVMMARITKLNDSYNIMVSVMMATVSIIHSIIVYNTQWYCWWKRQFHIR